MLVLKRHLDILKKVMLNASVQALSTVPVIAFSTDLSNVVQQRIRYGKALRRVLIYKGTVVFFSFIYHFWVDLEPNPEPSTGTACETGN